MYALEKRFLLVVSVYLSFLMIVGKGWYVDIDGEPFLVFRRQLMNSPSSVTKRSSKRAVPRLSCFDPGGLNTVACPVAKSVSKNESLAGHFEDYYEMEPDSASKDKGNISKVGNCRPKRFLQTGRRPTWRRQRRQFPNCNMFHEALDAPEELSKIAQSTRTEVFQMLGSSHDKERWVFKMNMYEKSGTYEPDRFESKRKEAVILERLSASPYVPEIYGFCGSSTLVPFAKSGSLYDLIKSIRLGGQDLFHRSLDTLRISVQLSTALAALHDIDGDGLPSFAHNDLDISQYVYNEDTLTYQLNDFNYGKFITYNSAGSPCKMRSGMGNGKYRAPEDLTVNIRGGPPFHIFKADVYSLGNALYMVLTRRWIFENTPKRASTNKIMRGERPLIPDYLMRSKNRATQAVLKAIDMCWTFDPDRRASAREVSEFLSEQLHHLGAGTTEKVLLPPLLENVYDMDDDYDDRM